MVEDVDVVQAHPLQRVIERAEQVLAGSPEAVGARPHVPSRLGRDHELVAVRNEVLGEDPTEVDLGRTVGRSVVVGQVEVGDALVEGTTKDGALRLERLVVPEVVPQPERDGGQLQAGRAETPVGHGFVAVFGGDVGHDPHFSCIANPRTGASAQASYRSPRRRAATVYLPHRRVCRRPVPALGSPLAPGLPGPFSALSPLLAPPPPPPPRPSSRPLCQETSPAIPLATSRTRLSEHGRNPIAELSRPSSSSPSPTATCGCEPTGPQPRTLHADTTPGHTPSTTIRRSFETSSRSPERRRGTQPAARSTPAIAPAADCPYQSDQHPVPRPKPLGPPGRSSPTPSAHQGIAAAATLGNRTDAACLHGGQR